MNDNRFEIFSILGVPPRGILLSKMNMEFWGTTWILRCLYDPDNPKEFDVIFSGCTKYLWEDKSDISTENDIADVIDILLGKNHHESPAIIATHIFLMEITYNELRVIKKW